MSNINLKKYSKTQAPSLIILENLQRRCVEDIERSSNESIRHGCILDRVRDQKWTEDSFALFAAKLPR